MNVKRLSRIVIVATAFFIILYDIWAARTGVDHGTISGVIWDWSHEYPMIPLAAGILMGHFFWQEPKKKEDK